MEHGSFDKYDSFWNLGWDSNLSNQEVIQINDNNIGQVQIADSYQSQNDEADLVSFVHDEISLTKEIAYEFSFNIKCDPIDLQGETILAILFKSSPSYTSYAQIEVVPDTEWQTVKTTFVMKAETDADARLQFRAGKLPAGITFYIDDISLMELE